MKPYRIITAASLFAAISMFSGCASARVGPRDCALILIMDGQQVSPSRSQFEAVQRKLGPEFEQKSLRLVPDLRSAELIATIECLPDEDNASRTNLVVRHIGPNTFTPISGKVTLPSLVQSEREHAEAMRGFTRAGID